jgi:hypothetical protein
MASLQLAGFGPEISNASIGGLVQLLGEVPTAGAILDRLQHQAQTIVIIGRSYRLKDHAAVAGKDDKNKKREPKPPNP